MSIIKYFLLILLLFISPVQAADSVLGTGKFGSFYKNAPMVTLYSTIIMSGTSSALNTTGTNYAVLNNNGVSAWNATEAYVSVPLPLYTRLQNFSVKLSAAPGAGITRTFTIFKNGVATTDVISYTGASDSGFKQSTVKTLFIPGDTVSIASAVSGGTAAAATAMWGCEFKTQEERSIMLGAISLSSSTVSAGMAGGVNSGNTTATRDESTFATNLTIRGMYSKIAGSALGSTAWSPAMSTQSFSAGYALTSSRPRAYNITSTKQLTVGTDYQAKANYGGSGTATGNMGWGAIFDTDDAIYAGYGYAGGGKYISGVIVDDAVYYTTIFGHGTRPDTAGESAVNQLVPVAFTASNIAFFSEDAPGAGKTRALTLRKNNVDTALIAVISGTNTFAKDVDMSHAVSFDVGDTIDFSIYSTGTATAPDRHGMSLMYYVPTTTELSQW